MSSVAATQMPPVTLRVGATHVIDLVEPTAAGYVWSMRIGGRALERVGQQVVPGSPAVVGGPSTVRYTLAGVRPGVSSVTFTLSRPWQPMLPPHEVRTVEITVEA